MIVGIGDLCVIGEAITRFFLSEDDGSYEKLDFLLVSDIQGRGTR